jgi:hypothetical protein
MVNGRITADQMEWLEERADEIGGNLSAALRQTIMDARLLELARTEYKYLLDDVPGYEFPTHDDGATRLLHEVLSLKFADPEDIELRERENELARTPHEEGKTRPYDAVISLNADHEDIEPEQADADRES